MRGIVALTVVVACLAVSAAIGVAQTGEQQAQSPAATDAAGSTAPSPVSAPPATEPIDAGTYAVRLRDLEQRINELKEQIFRSKARLSLLAETVLEGVVGGGQAVIIHENRMSDGFKLVRVAYALDGAPIFTKADEEGTLGEQKEFEVYNGSIVPGEHTLTVNLEYRGHGYGVFSYLKGYRFKVRSTYNFSVPEGRVATVVVVGYEKGGPTTPLEERPAVRYIERIERQARPDAEGEGDR
ncbi:MAG: dihydrolipoamide acetyltransferase [Myxococcota bacterium]